MMRLISLFALLAVLAFSGCTGQPSATQYQLHGTGIQFGYPSDWTPRQLSPAAAAFYSPSESESDPFLENVNVVTETVPAGTTLDEYVAQQLAEAREASPDVQSAEEAGTTLAGHPAREIAYTETSEGVTLQTLQTIAISGNRAVVVTYTAAADAYDRFLPQAQQIASTLQFSVSPAPIGSPSPVAISPSPEPSATSAIPWEGSTAGLVDTWRVRGQQTSRVLELRAGGSWAYGTSRGTWSVQPIADEDWVLWQAEPYGPTHKMVLDNWDSGQATGPIEYSAEVQGRVDAFWLYNEKVILQFLHQ